jgi:CheY-like chemotaxis protein
MADLRVMIIEDDELAAEILNTFIVEAGPKCEIEWVWNGFEALVRLQDSQPDVIFLDYMMPAYDGKELLQGMRRLQNGDETFIVVVSAFVNAENRDEFLRLGADYVLEKPVTFAQIRDVILRAKDPKKKRAREGGAPVSA